MTRIIILRHGQSIANLLEQGSGQLDVPLTEKGRSQAESAAEYLVANEKIDRIYSSDLSRAVDTAAPLSKRLGLPIVTDKRLREIYTGKFQGLSYTERDRLYPEEIAAIRRDYASARYPDGESVTEVYDRMVEAVCEISARHDGETVLIASHAVATVIFNAFAHGYPRDRVVANERIGNASISIYECDGKKAHPISVGFTGHLKDEQQ